MRVLGRGVVGRLTVEATVFCQQGPRRAPCAVSGCYANMFYKRVQTVSLSIHLVSSKQAIERHVVRQIFRASARRNRPCDLVNPSLRYPSHVLLFCRFVCFSQGMGRRDHDDSTRMSTFSSPTFLPDGIVMAMRLRIRVRKEVYIARRAHTSSTISSLTNMYPQSNSSATLELQTPWVLYNIYIYVDLV